MRPEYIGGNSTRQLHRWDFKPEILFIHFENLQCEAFSAVLAIEEQVILLLAAKKMQVVTAVFEKTQMKTKKKPL